MTYVPPCWLDIFIYDKPAHCRMYCVFIKQQWFFSSLMLCENTKFYQLKWLQYLLFFQCQVSSSLPPLRRVLQDYGQWNGCWQESSHSLSVKIYGKEKEQCGDTNQWHCSMSPCSARTWPDPWVMEASVLVESYNSGWWDLCLKRSNSPLILPSSFSGCSWLFTILSPFTKSRGFNSSFQIFKLFYCWKVTLE